MCHGCVEIRDRFVLSFDVFKESAQAAKTIELLFVSDLGSIESIPKKVDRFVVRAERNGKWMTIFSTMRKRESRRIREAARSAMNNFGNERQRLQCARAQLLEEQQRREIVKVALMCERENCAEAFQVHIMGADIVM